MGLIYREHADRRICLGAWVYFFHYTSLGQTFHCCKWKSYHHMTAECCDHLGRIFHFSFGWTMNTIEILGP